MPMVEVHYVKDEPLDMERKRAFVERTVRVFGEELDTPPERLRLIFQHIEAEDSKVGLVDSGQDRE